MRTFVLISRVIGNRRIGNPTEVAWWELRGKNLVNTAGGYNPLDEEHDVVVETIEGNDWNVVWTRENIAKTLGCMRRFA